MSDDRRHLLRGARIIDGHGRPPAIADILISNGIVEAVGPQLHTDDATVSALDGQTVAPGFIDTHAHDDLAILTRTRMLPKIRQGVTTCVIGNCGHGCAPNVSPDLHNYSAPILGKAPPRRSWVTFEGYLEELGSVPRTTNVAALVPHGPLRAARIGMTRRTATSTEIKDLAGMLNDALTAGAVGLSLGMMYAPGNSAGPEEFASLASVLARHEKPLVVHLRNEGDRLTESIEEAVSFAQTAGCPLHVSHLKVTGPSNHGTMPAVLDRLDQYRSNGADVTADVYPYTAGSTTAATLFPPWTQEDGLQSLLATLQEPSRRRQAQSDLDRPWPDLENYFRSLGPRRIFLNGFRRPELQPYEGRSIADIADEMGMDPKDALVELMLGERGAIGVILHQTAETDIRAALAWPWTMIGSDGLPTNGNVHPRLYGAFVRTLTRYSDILPLEEAIRRMTSLPSERFRLKGRGSLKAGAIADFVIMDVDHLRDRATFDAPRQYPTGVRSVFLNGFSGWSQEGHSQHGVLIRS